ncbi:MAG: anion transporter [Methanomicrobiales archaeon]|nr:anion transporter [Methanomicrobiales archaeon]
MTGGDLTALIPLAVVVLVFVAIAVRQVGRYTLRIWQIMLAGAVVVLLTGSISPSQALAAINPDVMLFLFGMFVVGEALQSSGYLSHLAHRLFSRAGTYDRLLLLLILSFGLFSALLMNDTLAIIGTPLVIAVARRNGIPSRILLLALAFSVTTGSVLSPIGNPQNLLIAVEGPVPNPFVTFLVTLGIPTLLSLALCYGILRWLYPGDFVHRACSIDEGSITDPALARLSQVSLLLILALIGLMVATVTLRIPAGLSLPLIALVAALPPLLASPRRWELVKGVDWPTLVFFAAMFVLMASVWSTGFFQALVGLAGPALDSTGVILLLGITIPQFLSNVPFVALVLPIVSSGAESTIPLMALAAGSTIAGNLSILGAASNVIIIQNAERQGETLTFRDFLRAGVPLTMLQAGIYWVFLTLW